MGMLSGKGSMAPWLKTMSSLLRFAMKYPRDMGADSRPVPMVSRWGAGRPFGGACTRLCPSFSFCRLCCCIWGWLKWNSDTFMWARPCLCIFPWNWTALGLRCNYSATTTESMESMIHRERTNRVKPLIRLTTTLVGGSPSSYRCYVGQWRLRARGSEHRCHAFYYQFSVYIRYPTNLSSMPVCPNQHYAQRTWHIPLCKWCTPHTLVLVPDIRTMLMYPKIWP